MPTFFISDLHLEDERPEISLAFLEFLSDKAAEAEALYVLGDFFEVWVGDDTDTLISEQVAGALKKLTSSGVPVYIMHGNRDFLIGKDFLNDCNAHFLPDPALIELYGKKVLLMHGDSLCTKDVEYQKFRKQVRDKNWVSEFLTKPLEERKSIAREIREASQKATAGKGEMITDVTEEEVIREMQAHQVRLLIHGHTHRPAIHDIEIDGQPAHRIVLGDWYEQGSLLIASESGFELLELPFNRRSSE